MFFSLEYQLRDELIDVGKVVFTGHLTTIILDALPAEKYSTTEIQTIRDSDFSLREIERRMKAIFINYSERLSVTKRSQNPYCKSQA